MGYYSMIPAAFGVGRRFSFTSVNSREPHPYISIHLEMLNSIDADTK